MPRSDWSASGIYCNFARTSSRQFPAKGFSIDIQIFFFFHRRVISPFFSFFRKDKLSSISVALDMFLVCLRERELLVNEGRQSDVDSLLLTITAHTSVSRERDCLIGACFFFFSLSFFQWTKHRFLPQNFESNSIGERSTRRSFGSTSKSKRCNHVNPREGIYKFTLS